MEPVFDSWASEMGLLHQCDADIHNNMRLEHLFNKNLSMINYELLRKYMVLLESLNNRGGGGRSSF